MFKVAKIPAEFDDRHYRRLGGRLAPILESIQGLHDAGIWIEIVTLLIEGFNDEPGELTALTRFIADVSPEIPWHVTAFRRDYRMQDPVDTTPQMLVRAVEIGRRAGLKFVYAGNRPGRVGDLENTRCSACGAQVIERRGFTVIGHALTPKGECRSCGAPIPGRWGDLKSMKTSHM